MAAVVKNADKIHNVWEAVHENLNDKKSYSFALWYIMRARENYKGKFSPALDKTIALAETFIHYKWNTLVMPFNDIKMLQLYKDSGLTPEIVEEKEELLSREEYAKLHHITRIAL